jgi:hypothetical protein
MFVVLCSNFQIPGQAGFLRHHIFTVGVYKRGEFPRQRILFLSGIRAGVVYAINSAHRPSKGNREGAKL